jgi:hypothetical protein
MSVAVASDICSYGPYLNKGEARVPVLPAQMGASTFLNGIDD